MRSVPEKQPFFTKLTPSGGRADLYLLDEDYTGERRVEIWRDGEFFASDSPHQPSDKEKKFRKIPAGVNLMIGKAMFLDGAEILAKLDVARQEADAADAAAAASIEPLGYMFCLGCDTTSTYSVLLPKNLGRGIERRILARLNHAQIEKHLHAADFREIAEATDASPIPPNLGIYWGYRYSPDGLKALLALAAEREQVAAKLDGAERASRDAEQQAAADQARASGAPVEIGRWIEECDDPAEDCSADVVRRLILPDGTIKMTRSHTH